ncbi:MAG: lytic transglycosylase domain-containing protein [Alphaproteobacteria bacterium]
MQRIIRKLIAPLAILMVCIPPLHTQAEISVPKPDIKPVLVSEFPVPAKKPELSQKRSALKSFSKQDVASNPIDPISKQQAQIYKRIFAFQAAGNIARADEELRHITDERLLGHVLFQRYMHPTAYKTSFEELKYWLDLYADHPGADKIYDLARKRQPEDFTGTLKEPEKQGRLRIAREPTVERAKYYKSTKNRTKAQNQDYKNLSRAIDKHLRAGSPSYALKLLNTHQARNYIDSVEKDRLRGKIAAGYFYAGYNKKAYNLASDAAERSKDKAPFAAWIAGLASWKQDNYEQAAQFFAVNATSPYSSGWKKSASAFWAARASMRTGDVKNVSKWLNISYEHPHTFYGLLAGRALGHDHDFNWQMPPFTRNYFKILNNDPKGRRAMALVSAGQQHLAESELLRIDADAKPELYTALLSYTGFADLPALGYQLGGLLSGHSSDGELFNAALYPKSPWVPSGGFKVDPALIHAIMRQESRFNPAAENVYSGASGLMQLMPTTAAYIAREDFSGKARHKLKNPQLNLDIGQKYIRYLLNSKVVGGDVIKLLVAYNAGPGNLQKWMRVIGEDTDPLMFIEMIPVKETRDYVEHVLSNFWIYRLRDDKETHTLDILAQGQWPSYLELQKFEEYDVAISN